MEDCENGHFRIRALNTLHTCFGSLKFLALRDACLICPEAIISIRQEVDFYTDLLKKKKLELEMSFASSGIFRESSSICQNHCQHKLLFRFADDSESCIGIVLVSLEAERSSVIVVLELLTRDGICNIKSPHMYGIFVLCQNIPGQFKNNWTCSPI